MKALLAMIAGFLLGACAGPVFYPVPSGGEGGYITARTPGADEHVHRDAGYFTALNAYGLYPWWGYTYYSPNFYPHYFAVWHPNWSYYADDFGGWSGNCPQSFPNDRHFLRQVPVSSLADLSPVAAGSGFPIVSGLPYAQNRHQRRAMGGQRPYGTIIAPQGGPNVPADLSGAVRRSGAEDPYTLRVQPLRSLGGATSSSPLPAYRPMPVSPLHSTGVGMDRAIRGSPERISSFREP